MTMTTAKGEFCAGKIYGSLTLRQKLRDATKGSYNCRRRWLCECVCGQRLTVPEYYLIRSGNPKRDCGCSRKTNKTHFNEEYRIWLMMHVRTEDPRHEAYDYYGGRGIKVCAEWHRNAPDGKGFDRYLEFVGPRPSPQHTIDRVNNDLGYQPYQEDGVTRQVRWATADVQRANQRPRGST